MTTPQDPLDGIMPYTLSFRAGTLYWYYIASHHQGSYGNSYYRHRLDRGEYQIMASYVGPDDMKLSVEVDGSPKRDIRMIEKGPAGVTRTGLAVVTITQDIGYISCSPITLISQKSVDEQVPLVLTIIPQQSFIP